MAVAVGIALMLVLIVVGSVAFHNFSPWYFTEIASNWGAMDTTVSITFWITGVVFIAVNLFMAYCVVRFRYRKDKRAAYEPENKKLETWLIALTTVGVAAMLTPGLFVWANFVDVPENAAEVEAVGRQWHWSFRFPGADNQLGAVDTRFISDENPFGIDPEASYGQDDILITSPELHLPLGVDTKILLRSQDVLHNFAVPQFRAKMDLVPGLVSYLWLTPTRVGTFDLLCEELCGVAHFTMRGKVVVEEVDDFQQWLASYPTFAETMARPSGDALAGAALYAPCAACHGGAGEGNVALNAPKLSGQSPWYLARQLRLFKAGIRGAHEKDTLGQSMIGMAATLVDDAAIDNVVAHIGTLPDKASASTRTPADLDRGRVLYETCKACHGASGHGIRAMNAPRLAGVDDWYLITQLKNFREGIRGAHPQDPYGPQMRSMAAIVKSEQSLDDLALYINQLK